MTWEVQIRQHQVQIGLRVAVSFQRTLRVPDDGKPYPLPPSLGVFPIFSVEAYAGRVPGNWLQTLPAVFIPLYQREALWLAFEAQSWKPSAVKIGLGALNALTGAPWQEGLHIDPQDYLVCPQQPWLDGIKTAAGRVRQFVAMPLGQGYSVEGQLSGVEAHGGLQFAVYDPLPGIFPDQPPPERPDQRLKFAQPAPSPALGLAAGGFIEQKIYPDPFGIEVWDQSQSGTLQVYLINSLQFEQVTGQPPPPSPVDAAAYTQYGLPWFRLYDDARGDLTPTPDLEQVKSISQIEAEREEAGQPEESLVIDPEQIKNIPDEDRPDDQEISVAR